MNVCRNCGTSFDGDVCPVCKTEYKETAIYPECCKDIESGAICYNRVQSQEAPAEVTLSSSYGSNETDDILTCGLNFELHRDGYVVTGIGECKAKDISIPSRYNNINVVGIAENAFKDCTQLVNVEISGCVKSIGVSAFEGCTSLLSVTIGSNIKSIGTYAFRDCTGLEEIYFNAVAMDDILSDNGLYYGVFCDAGLDGEGITVTLGKNVIKVPANLFSSNYDTQLQSYERDKIKPCTPKIVSIIFENGSRCSRIGNFSFYNCESITSVVIPDSVTSIGCHTFSNCNSLTSVKMGMGVTSIGEQAFYNCVQLVCITISSGVVSIGSDAFLKCEKLIEVYNLSSLTLAVGSLSDGHVAYYAKNVYTANNGESKLFTTASGYLFYNDGETHCLMGYTGTESKLVLPDDMGFRYEIYRNAFYRNKLITSLTIPTSVISIGDESFCCCTSLKSVSISNGVTSIGVYSFGVCTSLTSVSIPDSVTSIGDSAFSSCAALASVNLGTNTKYIGDHAFFSCSSLKEITIPDNVTQVLMNTFRLCRSLMKVTIGCGITSIGAYAFSDCSSLTDIVIPDGVREIDEGAFSGCVALERITIGRSVEHIVGYMRLHPVIEDGPRFIGGQRYREPAFSGCFNLIEVCNLSSLEIPVGSTHWGLVAYYALNVCTREDDRGIFFNTYEGFKFYKFNEKYYLIGYNGLDSALCLPDDIYGEGYEIIGGALSCCNSIVKLTISKGVTSIGLSAFNSCKCLEEIYYNAIRLKDLSEVEIQDEKILFLYLHEDCYFFEDAGSLGITLTIGADVERIPMHLFSAANIKNVVFEEGSKCKSIGAKAFRKCGVLENITIPQGVTEIGESAFSECTALKNVVIPDSVTEINQETFCDCKSLTTVIIGCGVNAIYDKAFWGCGSLKAIYYFGSYEDWTKITGNGVYMLQSVSIYYYSEKNPSEDINYWYYENGKIVAYETVDEQFKIATDYYRNGPIGYSEAAKWYRKAAERGLAAAQDALGSCYYNGYGVEEDYFKAVMWYKKAAENNFADAQNHLGNCYYKGTGVAQNYVEAVEWYRKAVNHQHSNGEALYNLGVCYENGNGVDADMTQAVKWYTAAANWGNANAQYRIGVCYDNGEGVVKDDAEASNWYWKAANNGHVEAQYRIGLCYENGIGVKKNKFEAVNWYIKASKNMHALAQFRLGYCYQYGRGVPKKLTEAIREYKLSARQGCISAQNALEKLGETW